MLWLTCAWCSDSFMLPKTASVPDPERVFCKKKACQQAANRPCNQLAEPQFDFIREVDQRI